MIETILIGVVAWLIVGYFVMCLLIKTDDIDPKTDKHAGLLFLFWILWPIAFMLLAANNANIFANFFFGWVNGEKEETAED